MAEPGSLPGTATTTSNTANVQAWRWHMYGEYHVDGVPYTDPYEEPYGTPTNSEYDEFEQTDSPDDTSPDDDYNID